MNKIERPDKNSNTLQFAIIASDAVVCTVRDGELYVRLIPVHIPPYFKHLAGLPGGLITPTETADEAVVRLMSAKGGIKPEHMYYEQLYTFSDVQRDPRGRVVAVAYLALVPNESLTGATEGDGETAWWNKLDSLPKLAYDHSKIVGVAIERLRARISYTTLIAKLMPKEFTLTELEKMYEVVLGAEIDKRNFRKKIEKLGVLEELPRERRGEKHRPAKLYRFQSREVKPIIMI